MYCVKLWIIHNLSSGNGYLLFSLGLDALKGRSHMYSILIAACHHVIISEIYFCQSKVDVFLKKYVKIVGTILDESYKYKQLFYKPNSDNLN